MKKKSNMIIRWVLMSLWLAFTVSLIAWWIVFGLEQIEHLNILEQGGGGELVRHQKMILWEGGALFLSLLGGGIALGYFMFREKKQSEKIQRFLATFTHELKTPLAGLRLQAEVLREDMGRSAALDRLITESGRLSLQLENSLFLADEKARQYRIEQVRLSELLSTIESAWPALAIRLEGDAKLFADRRAIEALLQNLFQNSLRHGHAKSVTLKVEPMSSRGNVKILINDNGSGFAGERKNLGKLFVRFYPGSGSGIGLHLVKQLVADLGGTINFPECAQSFCVLIELPGEVLQQLEAKARAA